MAVTQKMATGAHKTPHNFLLRTRIFSIFDAQHLVLGADVKLFPRNGIKKPR
jgi:hypothetical protein